MGLIWHRVVLVLGIDPMHLDAMLILSGLMFVYWTALEGYRGQSLGKMLLNIVVVGPYGEAIGFRDSALQSFGKAFLLPVDCLIGLLAYREKRQRFFNKLSDTVVKKQVI
jgi:uncharacterized RDD family membrane protein YckC